MLKTLFIDTGGTLNKVYNPITGELDVSIGAIQSVLSSVRDNLNYRVVSILQKDSLDLDDDDRERIYRLIESSEEKSVIIVHGTDTMEETAKYLQQKCQDQKTVILTGAMYPFSIEPIESSLNIGVAIGAIQSALSSGIYISMSGLIKKHNSIFKDKEQGCFKANT